MLSIPNQPIAFNIDNSCNEPFDYLQLIDVGDRTQIQFQLEPCNSINYIRDGVFELPDDDEWSTTTRWLVADNKLCLASGEGGGGYALQASVFPKEGYYQINIEVLSIIGTIYVKTNGGAIIGQINSIGNITININLDATQTNLYFEGASPESAICLTNVSAYKYKTNTAVALFTTSNQFIKWLSPLVDIYEDKLTFTFNWSDEEFGCYRIGVYNQCSDNVTIAEIKNSGFLSDDGVLPNEWDLKGGASYNNDNDPIVPNSVTLNYVTAREIGLYQYNVFPEYDEDVTYCVKVKINEITGNVCDVYFGETLVGSINNPDVLEYEFSGVATGNASISFIPQEDCTVVITEVTPCEIEDVSPSYMSEPIQIGDFVDCTLLISGCNTEEAFGFNFSNFSPLLRLKAKLKRPKYVNERTIFEDSIGNRGVAYFSGRKQLQLNTDLQPEYIHDFLRLLLGFDNVYINGNAYVVEDDEYNVEYVEPFDNVGKIRLMISEKVQNFKNTNCSSEQRDCQPPPNYLLQEVGNQNSFITLENNEKIIIR